MVLDRSSRPPCWREFELRSGGYHRNERKPASGTVQLQIIVADVAAAGRAPVIALIYAPSTAFRIPNRIGRWPQTSIAGNAPLVGYGPIDREIRPRRLQEQRTGVTAWDPPGNRANL